MPTGYTYPVAEGDITELSDFAMKCARAFGALVSMRDDPSDAQIPETLEPSTSYHDKALAVARALMAELPALSNEECDSRAKDEYEKEFTSYLERGSKRTKENQRIRDMIKKVEAWSTNAEGIKEFMMEQLNMSISEYRPEPPVRISGREWLQKKRESVAHDIGYHEKELAAEILRTEGRNRWLADLRSSLLAQHGGSND